jgi:hypothetical protein
MNDLLLRRLAALGASLAFSIMPGGTHAASKVHAQAANQTNQPNQPASALPTAARLTALVFPGWNESSAGRLQTVTLPDGTGNTYANWGSGPTHVIVEPKLVLGIDADHLTLIASMVPADESRKPAVTHLTPMALAAYQFERNAANRGADGDWHLARRQGIFAWRGFFGTATLRAVALAPHRQGIGVEYGSCWDGYCGTWLALFELDRNAVRREPAVEMALSGVNVDGAADCMRRLQPLIRPREQDVPAHDGGEPSAAHDCYLIDSSWSVEPARDQPGDLSIRYQGAMSRADAHAAPPSAVDQRQVLRYGNGKYRAVAGFNPVPPL